MSGALTTFVAVLIATAFALGFHLGRIFTLDKLEQESLQRQIEAVKAQRRHLMSREEGNSE